MPDRNSNNLERIPLTFPRRGVDVENVINNLPEEESTQQLAERAEKERDFELTFPRRINSVEKEEMTVVDWKEKSSETTNK